MVEGMKTPAERIRRLKQHIGHAAGQEFDRQMEDYNRAIDAAARLADSAERDAADNPELDGTDAAHPAWWRGHDAQPDDIVKELQRRTWELKTAWVEGHKAYRAHATAAGTGEVEKQ